jgi:hypothetical protein
MCRVCVYYEEGGMVAKRHDENENSFSNYMIMAAKNLAEK